MKKNAACTIVSQNYLSFAINLADSFKKHNEDKEFHILVVDKVDPEIYKLNYNIMSVRDLGIDCLNELAFKYNIVELNTAVKPDFLEYLYDKYNYEKILYIDPDMMVFNSMNDVYDLLNDNSIVLTPHLLTCSYNKGLLMDRSFLANGIYNLGFIGTKNDSDARKMLNWWKVKLRDECYMNYKEGLAVDQKWMDFAPAIFNNVYIMKHPGYNMAFWNLHERYVVEKDNEFIVNDNYKLTLFHFSSFKVKNPEIIFNGEKKLMVSDRPDLIKIYSMYTNGVMSNEFEKYSKIVYGFSKFENGKPILDIHRKLYGKLYKSIGVGENPFEIKGEFYKFLEKEGFLINQLNNPGDMIISKENINPKKILMLKGILKILRKTVNVTKYTKVMNLLNKICDINNQHILYS